MFQAEPGEYTLEVSYLGYSGYQTTLTLNSDTTLRIELQLSAMTLDEVVVKDDYSGVRKREETRNIEIVNQDFIRSHLSGSLMGSLDRLPGVGKADIGAGQSKPMIRGLGFNRLSVIENGIKHEAQQWGQEHGLEIDPFSGDRIEVIRGPASLQYGPEAIGGVIDIRENPVPRGLGPGGMLDMGYRSNNHSVYSSAVVFARKSSFFLKIRLTGSLSGDIAIPADSVDIYSYRIPVHENRLRNTAGKQGNFHFTLGRTGDKIESVVYFSKVMSKDGFFANAHGLEPRRVDEGLHDRSHRDIQLPYHSVDHTKLVLKNTYKTNGFRVESELGYQNNFRQEFSIYTSHGYMPAELTSGFPTSSDLEFLFNKNTGSGNLRVTFHPLKDLEIISGFSLDVQKNRIGGTGFIIPEFDQINAGYFIYSKYRFDGHRIMQAGGRFDAAKINVYKYYDWFTSPVIAENGDTLGIQNIQRAEDLSKVFRSFTGSLGYNHSINHFRLRVNAGKGFRMPDARELAANGVNYHHFSFEKGNPDLKPEDSWQLDMGFEWNYSRLALEFSPFLNYFSSYIFLNPGSSHDYLYGAGNQVFSFTQCKVFRYGGELHAHYNLMRGLQAGIISEYLYAVQLSGEKKGFGLPFSPPFSQVFNLKYMLPDRKAFSGTSFSLDLNLVSGQNKIVPPELSTPAYQTADLLAGTELRLNSFRMNVNIRISNLFNRKYLNHTSYYRIINIPEPGRNYMVHLSFPFPVKKDS